MRKITIPIVFLVVGFVVGWAIASFTANRKVEAIKAAFPPGYRKVFAQYADVLNGATREDIEKLVDNTARYKDSVLREEDIFHLGRISLLPYLQAELQSNNIAGIKEMTTVRVQEFLESHAKGSYQGSYLSEDWKELADSMAEQLRQKVQVQHEAGD